VFIDECIHGIFPKEMCSICNGNDRKRATEEGAVDYTFTAKFSGVCSCGNIIEAGDHVGRLINNKIVCEDCITRRTTT